MKYAYSIKTTRIKEKDFPYDGKQLTCTADLVAFSKALEEADIEKMLCVYPPYTQKDLPYTQRKKPCQSGFSH